VVDDWLCAASSALIVVGEICEDALDVVAGVGLADAATVLETSNGFDDDAELVDDEEDVEADEVSALMASTAADAAPRANNMAETPTNAAQRPIKRRRTANLPVK